MIDFHEKIIQSAIYFLLIFPLTVYPALSDQLSFERQREEPLSKRLREDSANKERLPNKDFKSCCEEMMNDFYGEDSNRRKELITEFCSMIPHYISSDSAGGRKALRDFTDIVIDNPGYNDSMVLRLLSETKNISTEEFEISAQKLLDKRGGRLSYILFRETDDLNNFENTCLSKDSLISKILDKDTFQDNKVDLYLFFMKGQEYFDKYQEKIIALLPQVIADMGIIAGDVLKSNNSKLHQTTFSIIVDYCAAHNHGHDEKVFLARLIFKKDLRSLLHSEENLEDQCLRIYRKFKGVDFHEGIGLLWSQLSKIYSAKKILFDMVLDYCKIDQSIFQLQVMDFIDEQQTIDPYDEGTIVFLKKSIYDLSWSTFLTKILEQGDLKRNIEIVLGIQNTDLAQSISGFVLQDIRHRAIFNETVPLNYRIQLLNGYLLYLISGKEVCNGDFYPSKSKIIKKRKEIIELFNKIDEELPESVFKNDAKNNIKYFLARPYLHDNFWDRSKTQKESPYVFIDSCDKFNPVFFDDKKNIVFGSTIIDNKHMFCAYDLNTGIVLWTNECYGKKDNFHSPHDTSDFYAVDNNYLYMAGENNTIYVLDKQWGTVIKELNLTLPNINKIRYLDITAGGTLFVVQENDKNQGSITAFDTQHYIPLMTEEYQTRGDSNFFKINDVLIMRDAPNISYRVFDRKGLKQTIELNAKSPWMSYSEVKNNRLYFTSEEESTLSCYDSNSNSVVWKYTLSADLWDNPIITKQEDIIILKTDNKLIALQQNIDSKLPPKQLWEISIDRFFTHLILSDDNICLFGIDKEYDKEYEEHYLYRIDIKTGEKQRLSKILEVDKQNYYHNYYHLIHQSSDGKFYIKSGISSKRLASNS